MKKKSSVRLFNKHELQRSVTGLGLESWGELSQLTGRLNKCLGICTEEREKTLTELSSARVFLPLKTSGGGGGAGWLQVKLGWHCSH